MTMTEEEYKKYIDLDFEDVDANDLKDIRDISIDRECPKKERIGQYLKQVGNPYLVRVDGIKSKIRFADKGTSMEELFKDMLFHM